MFTERGPPSDSEEGTDFGGLLRALADGERREILHYLRAETEVSRTELAEHLGQQRELEMGDTLARLEHSHLPKLMAAGLVTADEETVRLDGLSPAAATVLDAESAPAGEPADAGSAVPPEPEEGGQTSIAKLREQKRMFATLVSNLPGIAYRCRNERGWPMAFVSEGCRALTGYDPGDIEDGEVSWGDDVIHPDDRETVWDEVQTALDAREQFELTYRIRCADGSKRWVWEQGRGVFEQGELEAIEGFITDVTEQQRRERELDEQREKYTTLVEQSQNGVAIVQDREYKFANPAMTELTGYEESELIGLSLDDLIAPEYLDLVERRYEQRIEGEQPPQRYDIDILTSDGQRRHIDLAVSKIGYEGDPATLATFHDVTERRERERRLEAVFDGTYQFIGLLDSDGTVLEVNASALAFGGLDREDVVGEPAWETPWWQINEETQELLQRAIDRANDGEFVRDEVTIQGADRTATVDFSLQPVSNGDGDRLLVVEGRDISERVRREEQLATLNDVSQRLVDTTAPENVCEMAVEAARETLGLELASIELLDESEGRLRPAARTDAVVDLVGDEPLFGEPVDESWDVFAEQEGTVFRDAAARSGIDETGTPLDSAIVLPLGRHGVLIAGATEPEAFGGTDVDLARVLAAHVEAALDSTRREAELRERTESLAQMNKRLSRQSELNDVIRDLLQSLIDAADRSEIVHDACECLATSGPYRFAWIGSQSHGGETITPDAGAGVGNDYLDAVTVSTDDSGEPAARALRDQETVVENVHSDPPFEPWRKAALDRGFQSVIAIPLTYDDARYGVLAVYADDPDEFDDLERSVLTELAEAISYAIAAAERKQALMSEETLELEFGLRDPDTPLLRCVRNVGADFAFDGVVEEDDGEFSVFFTLRGEGRSELAAVCESEPDVADLRVVAERDEETLYRCRLIGDGLLSVVFDHGAVPQALTVEDGDATLVVELPERRNVREFTAALEEQFPSASLVARRQRDRQPQTAAGFRQRLEDSLTERNLEVAKTAYYSGFFEWPRENSGEEVAETLGITQPTFNRHLRTTQKTLFELLLADTK